MHSVSEDDRASKRGLWLGLLALGAFSGIVALLLVSFASPASADAPAAEDAIEDGPAVDTEVDGPPEGHPMVEDAEQDLPPEQGESHANPFSLSPSNDEEATAFEDLDSIERESVNRAGLWAETGHGHTVHSRWSEVGRERRAEHQRHRDEQLSGTQGLDTLGVQ